MKVFAAYSIKGGVGKTTTAVNLAYLSAREGYRTLLWDLDPQGAATYLLRVEPGLAAGGRRLLSGAVDLRELVRGSDHPGLDLLPADFSHRHLDRRLEELEKPSRALARLLPALVEEYDHLFLDCAPSISRVSGAVFVAADALLSPLLPTALSLNTLELLRRHLAQRRRGRARLLPFFTLVDRRRALHRELVARPPVAGLLATAIPASAVVEKMALLRSPLPVFAPAAEATRAYEALWGEVMALAV